jgi:hypothetical protein
MTTGFGFASIAPTHSPRAFAAAVGLANNAKVLVTGGGTSDGPFSAELYDDSTRTWSHSEMTTVRSRHTTTVLKSGQVLVAGGDNSTDPGTAEVYNPNTNSWQKVFSNLHSPRIAHTATLLADGRILVSGGLPATFGPTLNTVEIFDPGTDPVNGTWTVANPMNDGRAFHTATLLPNGTVLVAGGLPNPCLRSERPMPRDAPVTRAVLPERFVITECPYHDSSGCPRRAVDLRSCRCGAVIGDVRMWLPAAVLSGRPALTA